MLGLERLASTDGQYVALKHRPSRTVVVLSAGAEDMPDRTTSGRLDHLAFAVPDGTTLREWGDQLSVLGIVHEGVVDEDGRPSLPSRIPTVFESSWWHPLDLGHFTSTILSMLRNSRAR